MDNLKNKSFSLALEKWTNIEERAFITISVNHVETETKIEMHNVTLEVAVSKFEMKNYVFDVIVYEKNFNWSEYFNRIDYLNMEKCTAVTIDYRDENLYNFLRDHSIPIVPCFLNMIRNCIEKCFSIETVDMLFQSIYESTNVFNDLSMFERQFWITQWKVLMDYNKMCSTESSMGTFNTTFDENIQQLAVCLNPLKVTLDLLAMESIANSSLIKPLVTQLIENYFCDDYVNDSEFLQSIKLVIREELDFEDPSIIGTPFLSVSSFLDPRFKNLIKDEEIQEARTIIRQKSDLPLSASSSSASLSSIDCLKTVTTPQSSTESKLGLNYFFRNDAKPRQPHRDKLELEITKYIDEEPSDLTQCPIAWWTELGYLYPGLAKMATIYNHVPAYVHERLKLPLKEQIDFHKKRFELHDSVEKMLFLYCNKTID